MKKDDFYKNQLLDNDLTRGLSFSVVDGKNFIKAESAQVKVIQPTSLLPPNPPLQTPVSSPDAPLNKRDK